MSKNTVVILDSNNTLYRMYYTRPPYEKGGQRVESATATVSAATNFASKETVAKVISVFDANGKNFRHDIYPDYKATRSGMPDELRSQEILAQEALKAAGIPLIVKGGFEADDAIGMIAVKYADMGFEVIIETTDKDMMQLVDDRINLYNPVTKKRIDAAAVEAKLGVTPELVADFLAIKGDKQDNIIGVDGVGDKTAAKLLNQFGSVQGIIDNAMNIKGSVGTKIQSAVSRLPLNLQLTTINTDHSLLSKDELAVLSDSAPDLGKCKSLSETYGFNFQSIIESAPSSKASTPKARNEPVQDSLF